MFAMFNKLFSSLTYLFSATEKLTKSLDIVSDITVDTATNWRNERRTEMAHLIESSATPTNTLTQDQA